MGGEMLADGQARIGLVIGEWRDVGGGRGRWIVEDDVHDPHAAGDRVGALRAGGHARHGGVGDDPPEPRVVAGHTAELAEAQLPPERVIVGRAIGCLGRRRGNPLVPRAKKVALVVLGRRDQFRKGALLDEHRIEEEERLEDHLHARRRARHEVEVASQGRVRGRRQGVLELHPLGRESVEKTFDPRVGEHPRHRLVEDIRMEDRPALGQPEQLLVRAAPPEESRQSRGEGKGNVLMPGGGDAVEESGGGERCRGCLLHRRGEGEPPLQLREREGGVAVDGLGLDRPTEGCPEEAVESPPDLRFAVASLRRRGEELPPDTDGVGIEVGALDDRMGQPQEGVEEERREGQLVGLVVEAMLGTEILRIGLDPFEPGQRLEGVGRDPNDVG